MNAGLRPARHERLSSRQGRLEAFALSDRTTYMSSGHKLLASLTGASLIRRLALESEP